MNIHLRVWLQAFSAGSDSCKTSKKEDRVRCGFSMCEIKMADGTSSPAIKRAGANEGRGPYKKRQQKVKRCESPTVNEMSRALKIGFKRSFSRID